ncbi:MaoC family dehydratase [Nocardioides kongjuensis]|uniref:Acyl dehydratase n=1 Tax=Nocardioides kongjuensis TaxID=349522 RepID=A0A852RLS7_9ACTN|nr:MaoC family dehydratase [Nocardioides kongjuensis]NYD31985.1 acyl dehydratase [Nocardioides kongjuensis]
MRTFDGVEDLRSAVGTHLGYSDWHVVTQGQIDQFADATGDHQWIHVDRAAAAQGPFGTTVAHGYLTLAVVPKLVWQIYEVVGLRMGVNYGADRLRFPAPLPVDSAVRAGVELVSVTPGVHGDLVSSRVTVERREGGKPVCVVETLSLLVS